MKNTMIPMAFVVVVAAVRTGLAAEPIADFQEFVDEIGIWTAEIELDLDNEVLGKKGTRVKLVKTVEWGPGKKFVFQRVTQHADGKKVDGAWTLTGIDPATKGVVTHWFGAGGGYSMAGSWYRHPENKQKRILQFAGWASGDGARLATGRFVVEVKDARTSISQYVDVLVGGELYRPAPKAVTWTRAEKSK